MAQEGRPPVKVVLWQGGTEYPSLHIMITDNPRYLSNGLVINTAEAALGKIAGWLRKQYETQQEASKGLRQKLP